MQSPTPHLSNGSDDATRELNRSANNPVTTPSASFNFADFQGEMSSRVLLVGEIPISYDALAETRVTS